jgi:hypothetical protein
LFLFFSSIVSLNHVVSNAHRNETKQHEQKPSLFTVWSMTTATRRRQHSLLPLFVVVLALVHQSNGVDWWLQRDTAATWPIDWSDVCSIHTFRSPSLYELVDIDGVWMCA